MSITPTPGSGIDSVDQAGVRGEGGGGRGARRAGGAGRPPADLPLRHEQRRDQRRLPVFVVVWEAADLVPRLIAEGRHQRSTSPRMMSMLAIATTTSAMYPRKIITGSACRLQSEGVRMCTRAGRLLPSLTM